MQNKLAQTVDAWAGMKETAKLVHVHYFGIEKNNQHLQKCKAILESVSISSQKYN